MFEKNCHEYIYMYVHDSDFPLMRERERFSKFDIHQKKKLHVFISF